MQHAKSKLKSTHVIASDVIDDDGTDEACNCADAVGHAHEDGGVAWSDVQMVHIETYSTKTFPGMKI
jgi:hypothetical protein